MSNDLCVLLITPFNEQPLRCMSTLDSHFAFVLTCGEQEALHCLSKFSPDVLLLHDVPNYLDACQLSELLKGDVRNSHLPIVMLSESNVSQRYAEAFLSGVDDFVRSAECEPDELAIRLLTRINAKQVKVALQVQYAQQTQLILSVAHDMRTPLTVLSLNAHLLRSKLTTRKLDYYLDTIRKQVDHLSYVVESMVNTVAAEIPA